MQPEIHWVEAPELAGRVAIALRPRGVPNLEADVASWRQRGVDVVVSLLATFEVARLGLTEQDKVCRAHNIDPIHFPLADMTAPPQVETALAVIRQLASDVQAGRSVAFHCFASRGRAPTLAAALLVQLGIGAEDAIRRLSVARGFDVPETLQQRRWVLEFERHLADPKPRKRR